MKCVNNIKPPPDWFDLNLSQNILFYDDNTFINKHPKDYFKNDKNIKCKYGKSTSKSNIKLIKNKKTNIKKLIKKYTLEYKKKINKTNEIYTDETKKNIKLKTLETKFNKKIDNINTHKKCKQYNLILNNHQKNIIHKWIYECRRLYNFCVDKFAKNSEFFNNPYTKIKLDIFKELYKKKKKPAPYDMLTDEVRSFCSNLKSCYTNLKNGNIKHFSMNKKFHRSYSIMIPKKSISKNSIFKQNLGIIKSLNFELDKYGDSRLYYDSFLKRYTLYVPINVPINIKKKKHQIVALDPGETIFMAYHGLRSCGYIGKNIRKPILKLYNKIKKIQKILSKNKIKNKRKLIKRKRFLFKKIKYIVKELHNQTANFLCKKYKKILIPKFETQKMIRTHKTTFKQHKKDYINKGENNIEKKDRARFFTKKGRLNKNVKFVLQQLSHYSFRQHLINKCCEHGCHIEIVTEEFTSVTCTKCGFRSNSYNKHRLKECKKCKYKIDRDINGARNILIKNLHLFILK